MSCDYRYNLTWEALPECSLATKTLALAIAGAIMSDDDASEYLDAESDDLGKTFEPGLWNDVRKWMEATSTDIPHVWFTMYVIDEDCGQFALHALNGKVEGAAVRVLSRAPSWVREKDWVTVSEYGA